MRVESRLAFLGARGAPPPRADRPPAGCHVCSTRSCPFPRIHACYSSVETKPCGVSSLSPQLMNWPISDTHSRSLRLQGYRALQRATSSTAKDLRLQHSSTVIWVAVSLAWCAARLFGRARRGDQPLSPCAGDTGPRLPLRAVENRVLRRRPDGAPLPAVIRTPNHSSVEPPGHAVVRGESAARATGPPPDPIYPARGSRRSRSPRPSIPCTRRRSLPVARKRRQELHCPRPIVGAPACRRHAWADRDFESSDTRER